VHVFRSGLLIGSLLLLCLWVQPVGVGAQCMTASTQMGTYDPAGPTPEYRYITKYLSGLYGCTLMASNSARSCDTGTSMGTMSTVAGSAYISAITGGASPICSWNCSCGSVTVVPADLPVELMGFGIEGE
jgi:hypothetical protein